MLRVYLWKEWRELRLVLLMTCGVLLVMPVGLAWAVPEHAAGLPWFAVAVFAAAIVLGSELVGGEARRTQLDCLARLPNALRTAFTAKLLWLTLGFLVFGAVGLGAEGLTSVLCGGDGFAWSRNGIGLAVFAMVLATWLIATSCWWPGSLTALATVAFAGVIGLAPLVFFSVGRAGIHPVPLPVAETCAYAVGAGLALSWLGFRRVLARPRERRRVTTYVAALGLAFVPIWGMGAIEVWRWHHVDASSARIWSAFVGPEGRRAYLNVAQEMPRDEALYSVMVDLETGSWKQVGTPMSQWQSLHPIEPGVGYRSSTAIALMRAECSPHGLERSEIIEGATGEVVATAEKYEFEELPDRLVQETARGLSPHRTASGEIFYVARDQAWIVGSDGGRRSIPWKKGDYPSYRTGRGFRIANKHAGAPAPRYFDLERMRVFEFDADPLPVIRRGAWIAKTYGRRDPDDQSSRRLFRPETGEFAPVRGVDRGEQWGPLVDERRFVIYRKDAPGLWLVDPETGERSALQARQLEGVSLSWVGNPIGSNGGARTPSGAPVFQLNMSNGGTCLAKLAGDELICTPCPTNGLLVLASSPADDTVLVIVHSRTLERLRFGSERRDVLFPRSE